MYRFKAIVRALNNVLKNKTPLSKRRVKNFLNAIFSKSYALSSMANSADYNGDDFQIPPHSIIHRTFKEHKGKVSDKWEQYLSVYERIFAPFILANKPLNILEIGVCNGGFLEILQKIMPAGSKIYGIDIDEKCRLLEFDGDISVIIGDGADIDFLDKNFKDLNFDVIIDDASHVCSNTISSFEFFFERLNFGGRYIVEDCHTSYWRSHGGGFKRKNSTVEYFKEFIDILHLYYIWPNKLTKKQRDRFGKLHPQIAGISFYDSMIVIEKYIKPKKVPFRIYLAGKENLVAPIDDSGISLKAGEYTLFERFFR